jgi:chemotaxis protein MotB
MKVLQEQLKQTLAVEIEKKEVSIHMGPEGLVLSLREVGFFDSGSAAMRPQALAAFSRVVKILQEEPHRLRIEGHTDNIPIHTRRFASNWELSTARATEVVRLLIMRYDFSPDRLSAAGYGEFHPVADNSTLDGRQSNRRVDVVVLGENRK